MTRRCANGTRPCRTIAKARIKAPLKFPPGTKYSYSSMGILLSAEIAQKITGKPIADLVEERVFKPLGMRRTGYGLRGRANSHDRAQPGRARHDRSRQEKLERLELEQRILAQPGRALGRGAGQRRRYRAIL